MTVVGGGELFTGNTAVVTAAVIEGKASTRGLLKSWIFSYLGNFVGCVQFPPQVCDCCLRISIATTLTSPYTSDARGYRVLVAKLPLLYSHGSLGGVAKYWYGTGDMGRFVAVRDGYKRCVAVW